MAGEYMPNFNANGLELIKSICNAEDSTMFAKTITQEIVLALVEDLEHARKEKSNADCA